MTSLAIDELKKWESVTLMLKDRGFLPEIIDEDITLMQEGRIININLEEKFWDLFRNNKKNILVQFKMNGGSDEEDDMYEVKKQIRMEE
jgi:hypothetical protein